MRLSKPRISPIADADLTPDQREILEPFGDRVLNIFRTFAKAPKALKGFLGWGGYVLSKRNDLPEREREIVILRTGFRCKSGYEWTQHREIALQSGVSDEEIERIKRGPDAPGWTATEQALLRAADELHDDQFVSNATWATLCEHFTEKQCMDVVFTTAQYTQVSMILNSFGVQLDAGQTLDADLKGY